MLRMAISMRFALGNTAVTDIFSVKARSALTNAGTHEAQIPKLLTPHSSLSQKGVIQ